MHHRAVAAGAGDQVAVQPVAGGGDLQADGVDGGDFRAAHALAAAGFDHRAAGDDAHAALAGFFHPLAARVGAGVGDGHHFQAGFLPVQGHAVGVVVVGGEHQLLARRHAVAAHVGGDRAGQHVARQVVVGVHQRPLVGAGGEHHALGAHAVHAVAHLAQRRGFAEVVGEALVDGEEVVVVVAVHRGARQQHDFRQRLQLGQHLRHPFGGGLAVEGLAGVQQAAAELFLLVGQDHPGAGARGSQGRGQAGGAGADHQHVAVAVHPVVAVRVDLGGRAAQARGLADVLLVRQPHGLRVHEGLVVEAGGHHLAADLAEHAHQVVLHVRPAVGAAGHQARVQGLLGGAHVGHLGGLARADLQDGVGLLGAGRDYAAGAGVLEAAADHVDAVGQQGGGQAVAGEALVLLAVEGEGQRLAAVDATATGKAIDLAHVQAFATAGWAAGFFSALVTLGFSPIL